MKLDAPIDPGMIPMSPIMVLNVSAAKLAAWAPHSPDAMGVDRKRRAAAKVAAWASDPKKASLYGVHRKRWTPEEDRIVLALPQSEAARLLGRTAQSVNLRRWRLRNGAASAQGG
jgi:hypothetical protein